jgi:multidrug efflux pump
MMTSFAFILGVVPLIFAHGAGAEMRMTLGTTVFSGMLGVTFFGIFLTPVFFSVIDYLGESTVFRSRLVRGVSGFAIGMLSLRPARELVRRMAAGRLAPAKPSHARTPRPEPLHEPLHEPVGGPVEHT